MTNYSSFKFWRTKRKPQNSAFTLVELSVVLVILSLLIAAVIVGRALIDSAKLSSIQSDYKSFSSARSMFLDTYGCLPGDCTAVQVPDLVTAGLLAGCTTPTVTLLLNTNIIDNPTKRSCMMNELQLGKFINGTDPTYVTLTDSIASKNIPYAKFSTLATWDYRLVTNGAAAAPTAGWTFPIEAGAAAGSLASWFGQHILVLRNANTTTAIGDIAYATITATSAALSTVSSTLASKLDKKFDDGRPLSGYIMSGKNPAELNLATSCYGVALGTATPLTGVATSITSAATYLSGTSTGVGGCIVGYLMENL